MRIILAAMISLLATTAFAQDNHVQRYGEADKEKSQTEIQAEKDAQRAYQKSLGNIPDKGPSDPWGAVRSDTPKTVTSTPAAKTAKSKTKTGAAAN
ncbi:hypothetical protein [Bradyrhizobium sp. Tv2a-2]|uniref:hypothetical protein n=1 Tax=Bradyrhizobium sp. Tv2a-2 TaxID=113395 RepID=UPI0004199F4F|nr:hypothetical protein [Bradyrhizobium sp. Tv2a-2]